MSLRKSESERRKKLVGTKEAGEMLGWDKRKVATYKHRGIFPEPVMYASGRPLWTRGQVEDFKKNYKPQKGRPPKGE